MKSRILFIIIVFVLIIGFFIIRSNIPEEKEYKILFIASYHSTMGWVINAQKGLKKAFKEKGIKINYRAFYMDSKRKSRLEQILKSAEQATKVIKEWNPDITVVSDENALIYIALPLRDTKYKFVFCGINGEPKDYKLPSKNITGVLERHHFVDAIKVLQLMDPMVKKVAVISEASKSSTLIVNQLIKEIPLLPVKVIGVHQTPSFKEWKKLVKEYQDKVDAFMVILFFTLKDEDGKPVQSKELMDWTIANSRLPGLGIFKFFVDEGGLIAVAVNGYSQGYHAGKIAIQVLKGKKTKEIIPQKTGDGIIYINAKRARTFKLNIPSELLDSVNIIW